MKFSLLASICTAALLLGACKPAPSDVQINAQPVPMSTAAMQEPAGKVVIYQAFTRLFGNSNPTNKVWGSASENGVGKFNDINDKALLELKNFEKAVQEIEVIEFLFGQNVLLYIQKGNSSCY